jgi:hypothetical protein
MVQKENADFTYDQFAAKPRCAKISETPFLPEFTVAGGEGKSHEETFEWCGTNLYGFSYA